MKTIDRSKLILISSLIAVSVAMAKTQLPSVTLSASPAAIAYNGSTTLKWSSSNVSSCQGVGDWTGVEAASGRKLISNLTSTENYSMICKGKGESSASSQIMVMVAPPPAPTLSLTATPSSLSAAGAATLNWQATRADSCRASGGWSGVQPASGSYSLPVLSATTTFVLTCSGAGGAISHSATITVSAVQGTVGSRLGINLSEVNDWNDRQLTFVDVMKQARGFASLSTPWDPVTHPASLDVNGWPTTDFGVYFITTPHDPLNRSLASTYPSMFGTYSLSFTGQATLSSQGGNRIVNQVYNSASNTTIAQVIVDTSNTQLDLEFSNTRGGVQNLQLLRPGYASVATQVFTHQLLQALAPFSTIRFMEFLKTNANPVTSWGGRKQPGDPVQQDIRGTAWEYVVQLANVANKDVWINIPQGVDLTDPTPNNYVTQLAKLLKASLNPNLHVYVEYSNELWNTQFAQAATNLQAAVTAVNTGSDPSLNYDKIDNQWYWGYRLAAHQTVRISRLFAAVYGAAAMNTIIRPVYVSQDVQPYLTEDSLTYIRQNFGPPAEYLYAIGGAPFFPAGNNDTTLNGLFNALQTGLDQYMAGFTGLPVYNGGREYKGITFKSLADHYGLKSVAYEGGPDLSLEANAVLAEQAAGDFRINQMVQAELANFYGCGNDLFIYYKLAAPPGSGSVFGAYKDLGVPTPKSAALLTVSATPLTQYRVCTSNFNNQLFIQ